MKINETHFPEAKKLRKKLNPDQLYCAFGGGVGYFGANFSVFSYQNTNIWIDVGAGFEKEGCPGVNKTLPNCFLAALFPPGVVILTHGHEDHIGAFPYFFELIPEGTPVVTSPFTKALIHNKLAEASLSEKRFKFHVVNSNQTLNLKRLKNLEDIDLSFFFMPHSIPQTFSVGIEVKPLCKKLYFTSDFKIKGGEPRFNSQDIMNFAPVDFLFCDSTGSLSQGSTPDENSIMDRLEVLLKEHKGRVFITTFSSHIERLRNCFSIAKKTGRVVSLVGLSLKNYLKAAFSVGEFSLPISEIEKPSNKRENALFIISGCQADTTSSLHRLALDDLTGVRLREGDLLIYSSSIIPGNEESVFYTLNKIAEKGVKISGLNRPDEPLHASGHGRIDDILQLISWLKPEKVIPVHGDALHFHSFYDFITGKPKTKPQVKVVTTDSVYSIGSNLDTAFPLEVHPGFVDGSEIHYDTTFFYKRRNLAKEGICNVVLSSSSYNLLSLDYVGVASQNFINLHKRQLTQEIQEQIHGVYNSGTKDTNKERKLKEKVFKINQIYFKKKPYVNVIFVS